MVKGILAIVQTIVLDGEHGPYAVATSSSMPGEWITFSLNSPVFEGEILNPKTDLGTRVVLSDLRRKKQWRANKARIMSPEDVSSYQGMPELDPSYGTKQTSNQVAK